MDPIKRTYEDCRLARLVSDMRLAEERSRNYIKAFCKRSNTRLIEINQSFENGTPELLYVFDDNLGGYTLAGIIGSLI